MMTVRTQLAPSSIAGVGVFSVDRILKGAVVWRLSPWDQRFTDADLAAMDPAARAGIARHLYVDADGRHVLCFDQARFMNHSATPNLGCRDAAVNYALIDINPGEELTCDYREFDRAAQPDSFVS